MSETSIIGVDIGGVIISRGSDHDDTSFFGDNYLRTPAVDAAIGTLRKLSDAGFVIHLVSKCGKRTEAKTLEWLRHHDFYRRARVEEANVHFCRKREEKAAICQTIGAQLFVDDRLEVLSYLVPFVPHLYLINADPDEVQEFVQFLPKVHRVHSWRDVLKLVLQTRNQCTAAERAR